MLPELVPTMVQAEDVVIRREALERPPLNGMVSGRYLRLTKDQAYLAWGLAGRFLVRSGNEIIVDPRPHVDEGTIRLPLLGLVFTVLLHQRGHLVLHGSVVASGGSAIAILGNKGYGKSTMAAALCRQEYALVSDDTVALDIHHELDWPTVLPAFPRQKLWPDALAAIGENPEDLPRLHPLGEKRNYPVFGQYMHQSVPLKMVYIITEGMRPEIVQIKPQPSMIQLLRHLSLGPFGNQLLHMRDISHFLHCAELARQVPIYALKRPKSLDLLDDIIQMVVTHSKMEIGLQITQSPNGK